YSSFNHYSVARVKEIDPSLPCGLLYGDVPYRPWNYARSLGMDALHPDFVSLSFDDTCREAHALGVRVHPWTVNREEDIRACLAMGVDAVITNFPDVALRILGEG